MTGRARSVGRCWVWAGRCGREGAGVDPRGRSGMARKRPARGLGRGAPVVGVRAIQRGAARGGDGLARGLRGRGGLCGRAGRAGCALGRGGDAVSEEGVTFLRPAAAPVLFDLAAVAPTRGEIRAAAAAAKREEVKRRRSLAAARRRQKEREQARKDRMWPEGNCPGCGGWYSAGHGWDNCLTCGHKLGPVLLTKTQLFGIM